MVWSRALMPGTQEGTPLAYGAVLLHAKPARHHPGHRCGHRLWDYRRDLPDDPDDYLFAVATNRNVAIYGNLIIDNSAGDYVYAVDATTGEPVWETQILDYRTHPVTRLPARSSPTARLSEAGVPIAFGTDAGPLGQ